MTSEITIKTKLFKNTFWKYKEGEDWDRLYMLWESNAHTRDKQKLYYKNNESNFILIDDNFQDITMEEYLKDNNMLWNKKKLLNEEYCKKTGNVTYYVYSNYPNHYIYHYGKLNDYLFNKNITNDEKRNAIDEMHKQAESKLNRIEKRVINFKENTISHFLNKDEIENMKWNFESFEEEPHYVKKIKNINSIETSKMSFCQY